MILLIDGYNLLYALYYEGESLEKEELISEIISYNRKRGNKIFLVFDGGIYGGLIDREEKVGSVTIIYTSSNKTADDKIKELSRKYRNGCVVVSSDREVKHSALKNGSGVISSEDFIKKLYGCYDYSNYDGSNKKNSRKIRNMLKKI